MVNQISYQSVLEDKEREVAYQNRVNGQKVLDLWDKAETEYSQVFNQMEKDRNFYDGDKSEQWDQSPEGSLELVFNMGATIIDLYSYMLTNTQPQVQFRPTSTSKLGQVTADFAETQADKMLYDADFKKRFKDGGKQYFMLGKTILYPFWNTENKQGSEKGTVDLSLLNPFTTRLVYESTDYEALEFVITYKRMLPEVIERKYDSKVMPDSEVKVLPKTIESVDDGMTSVFRCYGKEKTLVVANGTTIHEEENKLGFIPAIVLDNNRLVNDAHGTSEISRWKGVAQELNAILTSISEISRDLGYPPLLEYNKALGGKSIGKLRGKKIPVRRSDAGEGLEFLMNPAEIAPLINQAEMLLELLHFVSLMPKAAAGIFPSNVTSGYQAQLAMQPATLAVGARKTDWESAIKTLIRMWFEILEKNNPKALEIELPNNEIFEVDNITQHRIEVVIGDNLPVDVAREVQNLTLGLQSNLVSLHQAVDRYNALLDLGSPSDTFEYLKQEADSPEISPERAGQVAEVKAKLQKLGSQLEQKTQEIEQLRSTVSQAQNDRVVTDGEQQLRNQANPTNLARGAGGPLPQEQKGVAPTARASVSPNSTGGKTVPPTNIRQQPK